MPKNIIRDFGKIIPQANNDDDAFNEIEDKINKGEIDTLIDNIDMAVQLKDKSFKIFEDYYDTLLEKMKQMIYKLKKFTSSIEKHNIADYFSSKL